VFYDCLKGVMYKVIWGFLEHRVSLFYASVQLDPLEAGRVA